MALFLANLIANYCDFVDASCRNLNRTNILLYKSPIGMLINNISDKIAQNAGSRMGNFPVFKGGEPHFIFE